MRQFSLSFRRSRLYLGNHEFVIVQEKASQSTARMLKNKSKMALMLEIAEVLLTSAVP